MLRIVVDVMGGVFGPEEIIRGVAEASLMIHEAEMILVGNAAQIGAVLPQVRHDGAKIRVHHAETIIHAEETPAEALAAKPDSSIAVAVDLIGRGEGDCLISAGHPGASVLACSRRWPLISGIAQPALAAVYPTELRRGKKNDPFSLILDVGACAEATAQDLVCYALMGAEYARVISRNQRPRVALLSSGPDTTKGPPAVTSAHALLTSATTLNYIGHIEGLDVPRGVADVMVCSGHVGNIVIAMLEGSSSTVLRLARYAPKQRVLLQIGVRLLSAGVDRIKKLPDWHQYGGAPLLGLKHLFLKADSRSRARAITNAVRVANKTAHLQLNQTIESSIAAFRARAEL